LRSGDSKNQNIRGVDLLWKRVVISSHIMFLKT